MLHLYRRLLTLRRQSEALTYGNFVMLSSDSDVLQYLRQGSGDVVMIALNLSAQSRRLCVPDGLRIVETLLSTKSARPHDDNLAPNEGRLLRMGKV